MNGIGEWLVGVAGRFEDGAVEDERGRAYMAGSVRKGG